MGAADAGGGGIGTVTKETNRISTAIDRLTFEAGTEDVPAAWNAPRFKRILVAVDGSSESMNALAWAVEWATLHRGEVTVMHVVEPPTLSAAFFDRDYDRAKEERRGQVITEEAVKTIQDQGVKAKGVVVHGMPVPAITKRATRDKVDLLVLGSHGRGRAGRAMLGSVADGVKNHVAASVLIAKGPASRRHILVPADGSLESRMAAAVGIGAARSLKIPCTVVTVVRKAGAASIAKATEEVGRVLPKLNKEEWKKHMIVFDILAGRPVDEILKTCDMDKVDLIVMGSRGLSGLRSLVPGSVSNRVAHRAKTSVLLIKDPKARGR